MSELHLYCDGGSRSNPGPSGLGVVGYHLNEDAVQDYLDDKQVTKDCIFEKGVFIEDCSNNFAEYLGLIQALNYAGQSPYKKIRIHSDSKLIVEQINGSWKVKSPDLKDLYQSAIDKLNEMRRSGVSVIVKWIPREKNIHADSLANLAMDRNSSAEYRKDLRHDEKLNLHVQAMIKHEELIKSIVEEPKRSKIRKLKESWSQVVEAWTCIQN